MEKKDLQRRLNERQQRLTEVERQLADEKRKSAAKHEVQELEALKSLKEVEALKSRLASATKAKEALGEKVEAQKRTLHERRKSKEEAVQELDEVKLRLKHTAEAQAAHLEDEKRKNAVREDQHEAAIYLSAARDEDEDEKTEGRRAEVGSQAAPGWIELAQEQEQLQLAADKRRSAAKEEEAKEMAAQQELEVLKSRLKSAAEVQEALQGQLEAQRRELELRGKEEEVVVQRRMSREKRMSGEEGADFRFGSQRRPGSSRRTSKEALSAEAPSMEAPCAEAAPQQLSVAAQLETMQQEHAIEMDRLKGELSVALAAVKAEQATRASAEQEASELRARIMRLEQAHIEQQQSEQSQASTHEQHLVNTMKAQAVEAENMRHRLLRQAEEARAAILKQMEVERTSLISQRDLCLERLTFMSERRQEEEEECQKAMRAAETARAECEELHAAACRQAMQSEHAAAIEAAARRREHAAVSADLSACRSRIDAMVREKAASEAHLHAVQAQLKFAQGQLYPTDLWADNEETHTSASASFGTPSTAAAVPIFSSFSPEATPSSSSSPTALHHLETILPSKKAAYVHAGLLPPALTVHSTPSQELALSSTKKSPEGRRESTTATPRQRRPSKEEEMRSPAWGRRAWALESAE